MDRRIFLKYLSITAGSLGFGGILPIARAFADSGRNFILVHLDGGADVTLGLDPWLNGSYGISKRLSDAELYIQYRPENVINPVGSIYLGPSASPIARFAKNMTIFNGIRVSHSETGHDTANNAMASGNKSDSANLCAQLNFHRPKGIGILSNRSVNSGSLKTPVISLKQAAALRAASELPHSSIIFDRNHERETLRNQAREIINTFKNSPVPFHNIESPTLTNLAVVPYLFALGICHQAYLQVSANLDSHDRHMGTNPENWDDPAAHIFNQRTAWTTVADLLGALDQYNLLKNTTIMVYSEFSRTPGLNSNMGKDHNPQTTSVALFGAGFETGRTIGGSYLIPAEATGSVSIHAGLPIRFDDGTPIKSTEELVSQETTVLNPAVIARTLFDVLGVEVNSGGKVRSLKHLLK